MYKFINENAEAILEDADKPKGKFEKYIKNYLGTLNIDLLSKNAEKYKSNYRHFYKLRFYSSDSEFFVKYFKSLQEIHTDDLENDTDTLKTLEELIKKFENYTKTIQLSFATKLLHSIDPQKPIYDQFIAAFYMLPDLENIREREDKLPVCRDIYDFLEKEYKRIINNKLLSKAIKIFRTKINQIDLTNEEKENAKKITDVKIIDFYIWQFSKMMKDPKQMNGNDFRKKIKYEM